MYIDPTLWAEEWLAAGDLTLVPRIGMAFQSDMRITVSYDQSYYDKYVGYADTDLGVTLNQFRASLVRSYCTSVIDVGVGDCAFIRAFRSKGLAYGYDVNPVAVAALGPRYHDLYRHGLPAEIEAISLWDTLEHLDNPSALLSLVPVEAWVFVSIPIFDSLDSIEDAARLRTWKHYRPGEHLTYWTREGLIEYFDSYGFDNVEESRAETLLGREDIGTFVFRKVDATH